MVVEEITITLSGGAPWGFRLQGGVEHQRPLQVAKVRKRSKACRAGLREGDELMSINERSCEHMSHAQAMNFIDSIPGSLHQDKESVILVARAPSPRIDKEYRAALRAKSPPSSKVQPGVRQACYSSPMSQSARSGVTSPFGSEAYYGETDSDADVAAHDRQRKQKRRSPSNSPGRAGYTSSEMGEASEMSGYDSAPDAQDCTRIGYGSQEGVVRREVVYQPHPSGAWSSQTSTETSSISADEQSSQDLVLEEDSGFQKLANVPLVAPERAKGALRLSVHSQLVPMVGPVEKPVDEELTKTYMDKAKHAKLNRGDTVQDKQVKEARKKCRTIACLLTDAPNPHSKGVLMFKKRRQRSKKYTLTSYGSVDEDMQQDSQEEDSQLLGSESEVDEEGFSAAPDPIWDSDYLEILEKRSSRDLEGNEAEDSLSTGLSDTTGKGARLFKQQRKRAEEHAKKISIAQSQQSLMPSQAQLEIQTPEEHTQPAVLSVRVKKQVKLQPPPVAPKPTKPQELRLQEEASAANAQITESLLQVTPSKFTEHSASITVPMYTSMPVTNQPVTAALPLMPPPTASLPDLPASSVLNRTARPFAPGFISHRAATAPVMFRPNAAKKSSRPVSVAASFSAPSNEKVIDVPSARFTARQMSDVVNPEMTSNLAPVPSKPLVYTIPEPTTTITTHPSSLVENIQLPTITQTIVPDSSVSASVITDTLAADLTGPSTITSISSSQSITPESPMIPVAPMTSEVPKIPVNPMRCLSPVEHQGNSSEVSFVTGGKTGILQGARCRNTNKPMFKVFENKKNSPNPELLSMVQNLDERHRQPYTESVYSAQDSDHLDDIRGRIVPPVPPKPRIIPEMSQIPRAEGKGAELFARRQNRRDLFVTSGSQQQMQQQQYTEPQSSINIINSSESSSWKYSPNVRAPPPIGYNPLLSPSCPPVLNRGGTRSSEKNSKVAKSVHGIQKEGIRAIDFMRRQPYQLNSAMFQFGGDSSRQTIGSSYQRQPQTGYTLSQPRQVPVKAARVYEIKRFSTPTPMSAPTINPTVIAPRSQTTLAEPLCCSDMNFPTQAPSSPSPQSIPVSTSLSARAPGLPDLPKISATPIFHPTPYSPPASLSSMSSLSSQGLQAIKQFRSAPELCSLPPVPVKPTVQAPKPRFIATRVGIQPHFGIMPLAGTPAPPNKKKKTNRIITDLTHITQNEYESEPEASEFDLGTKISTPKDVMLEELSLLKNKGSKMFKMRQLRVEKFIYENNPDVFNADSMDNFQKFVPGIGGQMVDIGGHLVGARLVGGQIVGGRIVGGGGHAPVPPPKPGSQATGAGSRVGAGGTGGGVGAGSGVSAGSSADGSQSAESAKAAGLSKKRKEYVKTYVSPWEKAMKGNAELVSTMKTFMPGPCDQKDLPRYKCFNRSAMPFGGFEKASQLMTFQLPDIEASTDEPEPAVVYHHDIHSRPSFNRTPIGWVGSGDAGNIHLQVDTMPFDGETDEL
ncbi:Synaptopodin 2-like protein [Bagarius yarrelli]|uniref:Synaptopodin 2-like protein n=1 Tax=Bagarius yarrelli TaxID=175774 RepID=A0A556TMM5_BAGYA|nr:Synaptopodin 2-like protein [Bagarius yarrelli]